MSGSNTLTTQTYPISTLNVLTPKEGPKVIPVTFDFSLATSYSFSLELQQQRNQISAVQSAFVDNSANVSPCSIVVGNNLQTVIVPGGWQGWVPLACPNPPTFTLSCTGGAAVRILFCNFQQPTGLWPSTGNATSETGTTIVSDPILDNCVASGGVNVNVISTAAAAQARSQLYRILGASGATTSASVYNGANIVYGVQGFNTGASAAYIHVFNSNAINNNENFTVEIPAGGSVDFQLTAPIQQATGLSFTLTGGPNPNDNTNLSGYAQACLLWNTGT
jgi:hypothetical protein